VILRKAAIRIEMLSAAKLFRTSRKESVWYRHLLAVAVRLFSDRGGGGFGGRCHSGTENFNAILDDIQR